MRGKKDNEKPKRGRPRLLNENDLERVEQLTLADLSLRELASVLGVSRRAIETFMKALPEEKRAKIQALRANNSALAKMIIYSQLQAGDFEAAKWLLTYKAKRESEAERMKLIRLQRKILERTETPEQAPAGMMSQYWQRVNNYFTHRDDPKPEQTDGDPGDNAGDQTDKQD